MFKKTLANEVSKKVCKYISNKKYCPIVKPTINIIVDVIGNELKKQYYDFQLKNTKNPIKKGIYFCKRESIPCNTYTISNISKIITSLLLTILAIIYLVVKII